MSEPIEIALDLPKPPSINALWRSHGKRVYRSREYVLWADAADAVAMASGQYPKRPIGGPFEACITLRRQARGDLDNFAAKAIFDWLQSRDIIRNDSDCERIVAAWGDIEGCRIILREWRP
jgi:Holliday junction resolvase RusA-like endonuclease